MITTSVIFEHQLDSDAFVDLVEFVVNSFHHAWASCCLEASADTASASCSNCPGRYGPLPINKIQYFREHSYFEYFLSIN